MKGSSRSVKHVAEWMREIVNKRGAVIRGDEALFVEINVSPSVVARKADDLCSALHALGLSESPHESTRFSVHGVHIPGAGSSVVLIGLEDEVLVEAQIGKVG